MENISTGLTWEQIQAQFDADRQLNLVLNYCSRRASLGKRKNGIEEDRKVWRLIIQKDHKNFVRTIFKKNLKDAPEDLLSSVASDSIVAQINNVIAQA